MYNGLTNYMIVYFCYIVIQYSLLISLYTSSLLNSIQYTYLYENERIVKKSNYRKSNTTNENQQDKISKPAWITIIIVSSTLLVMMPGETMLIPALPGIMREFGVEYNQSAWIFSSFLIVGAVMIPVAGKLSDTYNKKKVLLALFTIYIIGIVAGGFSNC
jgi:nitrate/nitrite transporter NarK